jgi:hypothetical protein
MSYVPTNIRQFASTRETSDEVALAIFELAAEGDEARMWTDPTSAELKAVVQRSFELAPDEDELHWGCETFHRGEGTVPTRRGE